MTNKEIREFLKQYLVEDENNGDIFLDGKWYDLKFGCDTFDMLADAFFEKLKTND